MFRTKKLDSSCQYTHVAENFHIINTFVTKAFHPRAIFFSVPWLHFLSLIRWRYLSCHIPQNKYRRQWWVIHTRLRQAKFIMVVKFSNRIFWGKAQDLEVRQRTLGKMEHLAKAIIQWLPSVEQKSQTLTAHWNEGNSACKFRACHRERQPAKKGTKSQNIPEAYLMLKSILQCLIKLTSFGFWISHLFFFWFHFCQRFSTSWYSILAVFFGFL